MSSILRALKKLENDPRHLETNQSLETRFVPLADTRPPKSSASIFVMVIGGAIVCGLVILTGWWLFSGKNHPAPDVPQQISRENVQQSEPFPVVPETASPAEHSADAGEPAPPAADVIAPRETAVDKPEPPPTKTQEAVKTEPRGITPDAVPAAEPAQEAPERNALEAAAPVQVEKEAVAAPSTSEVAAESEKAEIPVLDDPDMKLQAITWSKDPEKRIAVINNSILRQGETVYGYRIDTINQDDIVLSDGESKWQLLFRIR